MKINSLNGELAWAIVAFYVLQNDSFKSISGILYEARVSDNTFFYKGGNRNNGEEETISKKDFTEAFEKIKSVKEINTNTIKTLVPNSLYRKRSPFIGLLYSSKVIQ